VQPEIASNNPTLPLHGYVFGYMCDSLSYIIPYPRYNLTPYSHLDTTYIIGTDNQLSGADTLHTSLTKMTDKSFMFTTPAGTFK
jgi:hypothetical protein